MRRAAGRMEDRWGIGINIAWKAARRRGDASRLRSKDVFPMSKRSPGDVAPRSLVWVAIRAKTSVRAFYALGRAFSVSQRVKNASSNKMTPGRAFSVSHALKALHASFCTLGVKSVSTRIFN